MNAGRLRLMGFALLALAGLAGAAQAHIDIVSPNGGETITSCQQTTVQWQIVMNHGSGSVELAYSEDGGLNFTVITTEATTGTPGLYSYTWNVPEESSTQCLVRGRYITGMGTYSDVSDGMFELARDTEMMIMGAQLGGTLVFHHIDSCHPGKLGVTLSSLTGDGFTFYLPGGPRGPLPVNLVPDFWTNLLLSVPAVSITTLDGTGQGMTLGIPIPNNPNLVGLPMWAALGVYQLGSYWYATSMTDMVTFQ